MIYLALFVIIAAIATGVYLWNKPHRNIEKSKEDFAISAIDFYTEYSTDENNSNTKYLNKIIIVSGIITELQIENTEEPTVALKTSDESMTISCGFDKKWINDLKILKIGAEVKIKGKCDGLGMFGIVFTKCNIEK